jgi:hypothetical protein
VDEGLLSLSLGFNLNQEKNACQRLSKAYYTYNEDARPMPLEVGLAVLMRSGNGTSWTIRNQI